MRSPRSRRWTGPRRSCRCSPGLAERRSHDYVRHGTSTLFAALDIATGQVTGACKPRHRHQEFLAFLKQVTRAYTEGELHLVIDNYAAHKHPNVKKWLGDNLRVVEHFTPTHDAWRWRARGPLSPGDSRMGPGGSLWRTRFGRGRTELGVSAAFAMSLRAIRSRS
jgi:hypothetical protein